MSIKNKALLVTFSRFVVVGGISTAVNYGVFLVLLNWLHINYQISYAVGYISGLALGLLINNYWTFKATSITPATIGLYAVVYTVSFIIGYLFLLLTVHYLGQDPRIMNIAGIMITTITNFIGLKKIVYKKTMHV